MAKKKEAAHRPPGTGKVFVEKWNLLLPQITNRDNFKPGHLSNLKILCSLYEEYEILCDIIEVEGHILVSEGGRYGTIQKINPAVAQRNQVLAQIAVYSKLLGIVLGKDTGAAAPGEEQEWE